MKVTLIIRKITLLKPASMCWPSFAPLLKIHPRCVVVGPTLGEKQ